ncbi:MAG TPA: DEAD/DEAH box helicase [Deltaproteobacteria bacterium]|nr:DEAD/DEAH box helicase [Deltaproteobacteria bacterium]HCP48181.1 DEAD/DEAH box helicase [Deltaproteobacteria bacterium]
MQKLTFSDLDLHPALQSAVAAEGYTHPTPIQAQAIGPVLDGRDLLAVAQTGTGKTAAFALPALHRLTNANPPSPGRARVLVLTPTRELAIQIDESFHAYGKLLRSSHTVIYGGVGQRSQVRAMARGVDVLSATPGRLLDLIGQGHVHLDEVGIFILDEADRMLDMGFIHDVRRIIERLPSDRQTLLFSATMPGAITELSRKILRKPVRVEVTPAATTVERIDQSVLLVEKADKTRLLAHVLDAPEIERALVFTRTKHGANKVVRKLEQGSVRAEAIHGNKSQSARQRALRNFKEGRIRVLVATDIAARGIDVDGISHVINYDLPNIPESYVHRIGRTARAGAHGVAISFCGVDERPYLRDIERLIKQRVQVVQGHRYESTVAPEEHKSAARPKNPSRRRRRRRAPRGARQR